MTRTLKYSLWAAGLLGAAYLAYEEGPKLWDALKARFASQPPLGEPGGGGGGGASYTKQDVDTGDTTLPPDLHKTVSCASGFYDAGGYCKKIQRGIGGTGHPAGAGGAITNEYVQLCPPGQHDEMGRCVSDSGTSTQSFVYTHPVFRAAQTKE